MTIASQFRDRCDNWCLWMLSAMVLLSSSPVIAANEWCIELAGECYQKCEALGYNRLDFASENDECFWCYDGDGNGVCDGIPPPAEVPELEEYAAVLFLGLALLIGWRCRRTSSLSRTGSMSLLDTQQLSSRKEA